eukprot:2916543-Amphidinium_carterae.1
MFKVTSGDDVERLLQRANPSVHTEADEVRMFFGASAVHSQLLTAVSPQIAPPKRISKRAVYGDAARPTRQGHHSDYVVLLPEEAEESLSR